MIFCKDKFKYNPYITANEFSEQNQKIQIDFTIHRGKSAANL